jgi:hypothetical protein
MSSRIEPPADSHEPIAASGHEPLARNGHEPLAATAIAAFEAGVRATTDLQRRVATAIPIEPVGSILSTTADWTRDVGAAAASIARWLTDA